MTKMLATRLYDAKFDYDHAEEEVCEMLSALLGEGGWEDFTADHYDRSIEIFGVADGLLLSPQQQETLWAHGFDCCWTHVEIVRLSPPSAGEKFYCQAGNVTENVSR